jgi:hypothetical protein
MDVCLTTMWCDNPSDFSEHKMDYSSEPSSRSISSERVSFFYSWNVDRLRIWIILQATAVYANDCKTVDCCLFLSSFLVQLWRAICIQETLIFEIFCCQSWPSKEWRTYSMCSFSSAWSHLNLIVCYSILSGTAFCVCFPYLLYLPHLVKRTGIRCSRLSGFLA